MYSKILKSLIMPLADKVMETKIMYFYNEIKKMQNFTKSEIVDWQEAMLKRIITHSYNNTEYYNNLFKKNNLKNFFAVFIFIFMKMLFSRYNC